MSWLPKWFRRGTESDARLTLKLRLVRWRHLLRVEESFLNLLADMRDKLSGEYVLDRQYIISSVGQIFQKSYQLAYDMGMVRGLDEVPMYPWLDGMRERTMACLRNWPLIEEGPLVVPLPAGEFWRSDRIGEMACRLLEVGRAGLAEIPRGFIITIPGFLHLLRHNHLDHHLRPSSELKRIDWTERHQSLTQALLQAEIPGKLKEAVEEALRSLETPNEPSPSLVLWASPLGPGAMQLFPLPVWEWSTHAGETFWDGLRSLWSQVYLTGNPTGGYPTLSALICCRKVWRGNVYRVQTVNPEDSNKREVLVYGPIHAFPPGENGGNGGSRLCIPRSSSPQGGESGPPEAAGDHSIEARLASLSLRVENYFKRALEILWGENGSGEFYLIQLRLQDLPFPLRSAFPDRRSPLPKKWPSHYIRQGQIVSRGIASGPAVHPTPGRVFPEGGILVARGWCPEWTGWLPKMSGLLVEEPLPPSLAFLARSYRLPAICRLPGIAQKFGEGTVVTVDAEDNIIYENRVEPLLYAQLLERFRWEDEPEYLLLERVLKDMDPTYSWEEKEMGPPIEGLGGCRTLLEGIRWARTQVIDFFSDKDIWQRLVPERGTLSFGPESTLPVYALDLDGDSNLPEPAMGPAAEGVHNEIDPSVWQGINNLPFVKNALTIKPEEESPVFFVRTENTFFLSKCAAKDGLKDRMILDSVFTGIPELDHFFFYWEGKNSAHGHSKECRPSGRERKKTIREIRVFGKSVEEMKRQIPQAGGE
jgi:phosphohistidine swiveling domain-containing protein